MPSGLLVQRLQALQASCYAPTAGQHAPAAGTPAPAYGRDAMSLSPGCLRSPVIDFFPIQTGIVDLAGFLQGFRTGGNIRVSATGFFGSGMVNGSGVARNVASDGVQMDLHINSPVGNADLAIDLRQEGDNYRLHAPENWPASVTIVGNRMTIQNLEDPNKRLVLTRTAPGRLEVRTWGLGYDGKTLVFTATN